MPIPFENKNRHYPDEKHSVAFCVWDRFIREDPNPRILIDAGSSAMAVAKVVAEELKRMKEIGEEYVSPTVFTHNLAAWEHLSRSDAKIDLYLLGGRYNPELNANVEPVVFETQLKEWTPNIAVIAVSGIDEYGLYCSNIQDEAPVKKALARKRVEKRIVVCDHTKIGRTDVSMFAKIEDLTEDGSEVFLVTNSIERKLIDKSYTDVYNRTIEAFQKQLKEHRVIMVDVPAEDNTDIDGSNETTQ